MYKYNVLERSALRTVGKKHASRWGFRLPSFSRNDKTPVPTVHCLGLISEILVSIAMTRIRCGGGRLLSPRGFQLGSCFCKPPPYDSTAFAATLHPKCARRPWRGLLSAARCGRSGGGDGAPPAATTRWPQRRHS